MKRRIQIINDFINKIINTDNIDVWYESICFIFNEFISSQRNLSFKLFSQQRITNKIEQEYEMINEILLSFQ